ncbi:MAG: hypothetical protein KDE27_31350 [Planctomycetes bacterium]|nr:hypothetical protein [Planctomycetota bacterium]
MADIEPTTDDQRLLQKFRDGELGPSESTAFAARLAAEPTLRAGLQELEELTRGFAADRARTFTPPAGFTASVLAEVRQLPNRLELRQIEVSGVALTLCRRLLLAAAILFGIGLCWHAGLFPNDRSDKLEAAPADELQQEIDRLDAIARTLDK